MKATSWPVRRAAAAVLATALLAACAPSDSASGGTGDTTAAATPSVPQSGAPAGFDVPAGADLQGVFLEYGVMRSLDELLSETAIVVVGSATAVDSVIEVKSAPVELPSDAPDFKRTAGSPILQTRLVFEVRDVLKGDIAAGASILVSETGRIEAPLMKPGTTYLLFLGQSPSGPNIYYEAGGADQARYVVDGEGIVRSSTGFTEPYDDMGWQSLLLGQRLDAVRAQIR
jgi:hypothetical protein